jgi:hypothetical protein
MESPGKLIQLFLCILHVADNGAQRQVVAFPQIADENRRIQ